MLDAIWQLLSDNGLDTADIAGSIQELFIDNGDGTFDGILGALGNFPVLGDLLKLLVGFAPDVTSTLS